MSGTMYRSGEILIIPFPFSDSPDVKRRPVVVLLLSAGKSVFVLVVIFTEIVLREAGGPGPDEGMTGC